MHTQNKNSGRHIVLLYGLHNGTGLMAQFFKEFKVLDEIMFVKMQPEFKVFKYLQ